MATLRKRNRKWSLEFIGFLQALGLLVYCSLVAIIIWNGNRWFPKFTNFTGPLLFLVLFSTSALVCGLIVGSYPIILFWDKKKTKEAVKLVIFTAMWAVFFLIGILFFLFFSR